MEQTGAEVGESERGRRGVGWWAMWVLVAVLGYALSVGPVMRFCRRAFVNNRAVRTFYRPLVWSWVHCEPSRRVFNWYLNEVWHAQVKMY